LEVGAVLRALAVRAVGFLAGFLVKVRETALVRLAEGAFLFVGRLLGRAEEVFFFATRDLPDNG